MKLGTFFAAIALALFVGFQLAGAQNTVYWDVNGSAPGAGESSPGFTDGVWGTDPFWNSAADGTSATGAWVAGDNAVFSAGSDATDAFIDITGTQVANSILIEEGTVTFGTGTADTGAGNLTINAGATLKIGSTLRLNTGAGKVVLNGGTLINTNTGSGGSFIGTNANATTGDGGGLKGLEVDGIGYIGYDNGDNIADNAVSIFGGVITGAGGTVNNGGAGTLVKIGPDQIGIAVTDQDFTAGAPRVHNQSLFTFAKLRVDQGAYRLRHQTQDNTVRETAFGAVPLAELADAITLNGGGIGSNTTVTLHANRGITVTANGGYLDHGATAGLNIPGPLTAAAGATLTIGSPTSTATNNVTFSLSHANNVNTFQGNIHARRGVLRLDTSLNAANFSGTGMDATNIATVNVTAGQTFTFGSGNANTTFDGIVAGAGTWRKVGTGTTTFTGTANTHSGDTVIEAGTLSITSPYLSNSDDVYISSGGVFDLNFAATDVIDSLFFNGVSQIAGTWGAVGSTAVNQSEFFTGTGILDVTTFVPPAGLSGDYNDDGTVNAADYAVWRDNNGGTAVLPNDDTPGTVDQSDYDVWVANFGNSGGGAGAGAVPEPGTIGLALISILAVFSLAARKRR
jgi:autotransporter-associated beta strand protein